MEKLTYLMITEDQVQIVQDAATGNDARKSLQDAHLVLAAAKLETKPKRVKNKYSYRSIYRYASGFDWILIVVGTLCAMVNGASLPVMTLFFGDILNAFPGYEQGFLTIDTLNTQVTLGVLKMTILAGVTFVCSYGQMTCWMVVGENISCRIRQLYFRAIMRQDVAWFDKTSTGELTTRITADTSKIQEGLSDKVGLMIQFFTSFVGGFIIGYYKGWQLALVLTSVFPVLASAAFIMSKLLMSGTSDEQDAYADAGSVAQQVISSMRTVVSFGGEEREIKRYAIHLQKAETAGLKKAMQSGIGVGAIQMIIFCVYALAFFYGNIQIYAHVLSQGEVLSVFFAIIIGAFSLGNASPHIGAIGSAEGAAQHMFETIDRVSPIDPSAESGLKPSTVVGKIEFKGIDFHYPTREDVKTLVNFNLTVEAGKTVALVGASGSGKSTIVKLVERFYDPVQGSVTLDEQDIRSLNVTWLRQQIGIVSQEPTLFDTTIRQNLIYGLKDDGSTLSKAELDGLIEKSLKEANAWDFVQKLPKGVDTGVGEAGSMLSGGQKQRIAIARAIMKDPRILLLDEATSALDTESERIVQAALDVASKNRTTIVIAHRLSTIKNADLIIVMAQGEVLETGTHNSLLEAKGAYHSLVQAQKLKSNTDESEEDISNSPALNPSHLTPEELKKSQELGPRAVSEEAVAIQIDKEPVKSKPEKVQYFKILALNRPEYPLMVLGAIGAAANGVVMPLFSILFSSAFISLGTDRANFWSAMFAVLGVAGLISNFLQIGLLKYTGEKVTRRLREMSFAALLRQEIGFFDQEENSTGALTAKLADDASLVSGITGPTFGAVVQGVAGFTAGLVIAFKSSWQLSLVIIGMVPLIAFAGWFQLQSLVGYGAKSRVAYEKASQVACEAISSVRTVLTITQEQTFIKRFEADIKGPHQMVIQGAIVSGFGYALSQGILLFAWAVSFYYGSRLIIWHLATASNVIQATFAIIFTAMATGQINNHTPDAAKAKLAALAIYKLLDRVSAIDVTLPVGEVRQTSDGLARLVDAKFHYPSRPDNLILKGLNIDVKPGTTLALVGRSGCGKSTTMGILERWYDLSGGQADMDGLNVTQWNLKSLRSHMALVGQEPILFNTSIRDNIAYGSIKGEALDDEIEAAAKLANIHEFVIGLPDGYKTMVGEKGGQISGGQKQRIAIARALIRNPRLLLLDEATSALDSESEKVVQKALDAASAGRTTIVIAHRLSTIQNADKIIVVNNGRVAEFGTHFELVEKHGEYFDLVSQQMLGKKKVVQSEAE